MEKLKAERNAISKEVGVRKAKKESADDLLAGMKEKSDKIANLDKLAAEVEAKQEGLLLSIPNIPWEGCPKGSTAAENPVVSTWGEPKKFDFQPKDHVALGEALGILDFAASAKVSGSGFAVYRGAGRKVGEKFDQLDVKPSQRGARIHREFPLLFWFGRRAWLGRGNCPSFVRTCMRWRGANFF